MVSSFFGGQGLFECLKCPCVVDLYSFFFPTAYPETGVWMLLNSEAFYMRITFVKASLGRLAELISTSFTSASLFTCILRGVLIAQLTFSGGESIASKISGLAFTGLVFFQIHFFFKSLSALQFVTSFLYQMWYSYFVHILLSYVNRIVCCSPCKPAMAEVPPWFVIQFSFGISDFGISYQYQEILCKLLW
jgi:hypothetical protein